MCVCAHMYVCFFDNTIIFYFQSVENVNTDQLDELIKVIMIVRTHTVNNVACSVTHSLVRL